MKKYFNVEGSCNPEGHYMVNLENRLRDIKDLVDRGKYFSINRARQYGKTTILNALAQYLVQYYSVISLDFQLLSYSDFENERAFVSAFSREILQFVPEDCIPQSVCEQLKMFSENAGEGGKLAILFQNLSKWCASSEKPVVLIIDEVDSATNNQVFLDFLSQMRGYYIHRRKRAAFWSVILAGVYDIKHLKLKIRGDPRLNSPWNTHAGNEENERLRSFDECPWYQREYTPFDIAADFTVDMGFLPEDIAGMLSEYESDYQTGMGTEQMASLLYEYTSGYPFLVSRLCQIMDERLAGSREYSDKSDVWTKSGLLDAVKILLSEKNTLFDSLIQKLSDYPALLKLLHLLLFTGRSISYNSDDEATDMAAMFGFIKNKGGTVIVANRIFEVRLYNYFLTSDEIKNDAIYKKALQDKNLFIRDGHLDMELVLEKFVLYFNDLYGDRSEAFLEEDGRRYFLLYLRPIINGVGNYYIESRTRSMKRTDVIVDYRGEQFVIEMKIWHGREYHTRGENQLREYLDFYYLRKGYMLSFCFNKNKRVGMNRVNLGDKVLVEAVV